MRYNISQKNIWSINDQRKKDKYVRLFASQRPKKKKKNTDTLKNTMEWNSTSDLL